MSDTKHCQKGREGIEILNWRRLPIINKTMEKMLPLKSDLQLGEKERMKG